MDLDPPGRTRAGSSGAADTRPIGGVARVDQELLRRDDDVARAAARVRVRRDGAAPDYGDLGGMYIDAARRARAFHRVAADSREVRLMAGSVDADLVRAHRHVAGVSTRIGVRGDQRRIDNGEL